MGGKRARRGIQGERKRERTHRASSARSRTRGDDFRERGLRYSPRRSTASPSSTVPAAARIFLPLSGPLSQSSSFFSAGPPSRRARCFSPPADRVDFSFRASARPRPRATMAACPKIRRWGGALSRDPRVFFAGFPRATTLFFAHPRLSSPRFAPAAPLHFFLSPFLVFFFRPDHPSRTPSSILHLHHLQLRPQSTSTSIRYPPSPSRSRVRRSPRLCPQGCILRGPSNPRSP